MCKTGEVTARNLSQFSKPGMTEDSFIKCVFSQKWPRSQTQLETGCPLYHYSSFRLELENRELRRSNDIPTFSLCRI